MRKMTQRRTSTVTEKVAGRKDESQEEKVQEAGNDVGAEHGRQGQDRGFGEDQLRATPATATATTTITLTFAYPGKGANAQGRNAARLASTNALLPR
mgnify:CR=1 FL=1